MDNLKVHFCSKPDRLGEGALHEHVFDSFYKGVTHGAVLDGMGMCIPIVSLVGTIEFKHFQTNKDVLGIVLVFQSLILTLWEVFWILWDVIRAIIDLTLKVPFLYPSTSSYPGHDSLLCYS
ncbi:hypothetical protein FRX31_033474 [Thalictrum thalictroides]|uniref:Uncharacterized protein n=1 Tax=Thalictrum thalictroides TaxID=46969 RepID=A0A7J6UWK2_THATH|nr:hypothetical protein FRX31_033474 [Thalictrum thalictroides]